MLTDKEKKQLRRFEEALAMPKWKYILFTGVLSWGVLTAILYSIFNFVISKTTFTQLLQKELWLNLVTFMFGGILFGLLMRGFVARQVRILRQKEQSAE